MIIIGLLIMVISLIGMFIMLAVYICCETILKLLEVSKLDERKSINNTNKKLHKK